MRRLFDLVMNRLYGGQPTVWYPARFSEARWKAAGVAIFDTTGDERAAVIQEVAAEFRQTREQEWQHRYPRCREWRPSRRQVQQLELLPADDAIELLGFASFSGSGIARQAAVEGITRLRHPRGVPYVLLRLDDWVPQVRRKAWVALEALLDSGVATELVKHRRLIERLERVRRIDSQKILQRIREALQDAGSVADCLASDDSATRLFILRLLEHDIADRPDLVEHALQDRHPVVRSWIAGQVARRRVPVSTSQLRALLVDRSTRVSTTTIRSLMPDQIQDHRETLVECAMADGVSVRRSARFALSGSPDLADELTTRCRELIERAGFEDVRSGWVACLTEIGGTEAHGWLTDFLHHPKAGVRAAAIGGLARLRGEEEAVPDLIAMLDDPNNSVRRVVIGCLAGLHRELWADDAMAVLRADNERGGIAALLALAIREDWESIPAILIGLQSRFQTIRGHAWKRLSRCQNRLVPYGWIKPSTQSLKLIEQTWPDVREIEPDQAHTRLWKDFVDRVDKLLGER